MNNMTKKVINRNTGRYLAFMLTALLGISVVSCATIEGAGKDIETAGEEIQDAADDN
jgi:predicted small secreted protein